MVIMSMFLSSESIPVSLSFPLGDTGRGATLPDLVLFVLVDVTGGGRVAKSSRPVDCISVN